MLKNLYQNLAKPILFRLDAETVHTRTVHLGEALGTNFLARQTITSLFGNRSPKLATKVAGITFPSPIGLAAGFDYEGRLTAILPCLGFGFQTIGTITNLPYEGNKKPILGRLPEQKSLIVNKGFKNLGADEMVKRLRHKTFAIPVGISIGKTNSKDINTQKTAIADIVSCFKKFEAANLAHSYYELNISCPNLFGPVSFYPSKNLAELLEEVDKLKIAKPLFIKMPITESDNNVLAMLDTITKHKVAGIIIGNLAKNPNYHGGLSGKPTWARSNELISLAHKKLGSKLIIIGCGGVSCASDAKEKLRRGASLVQLITGMVYEGPQLVSEINVELST